MPTYSIDAFAGGRDKRPRVFYGREKDRFKNLDDAYIGKDKKVHRRFPLRFAAGTVSTGGSNGFGAVSIDGVLTYFAPKTATPVVTIPGVTTAVLQFDELGGHVADRIIDAKLFNGSVVALIRHAFTSLTGLGACYTYKLHVFDGKAEKPTFVEDAWFPTCWGPTLPLHVYRTGTLGAFLDYVPRMGIAAGKVYVSGPDNNLYFSAPSNARVWNTRTQTQTIAQGEWFYWPNYDTFAAGDDVDTTAAVSGVSRWIISETGTDILNPFGRFTCYVLEYCDTSGTWQKFLEDASVTKTGASFSGAAPTVQGHYQVVTIVGSGPYGGGAVIGFRMKMPTGTTPIIRFRLLVSAPPITITSGAWTSNTVRTAGRGTYEDVAFTFGASTTPGVGTDNYGMALLIQSPVSTYASYVFQTVTAPGQRAVPLPSTGYDRYTNLVAGVSWRYHDGTDSFDYEDLTNYLYYESPVRVAGIFIGTTFVASYGYGTANANNTFFFARRSAIILGNSGDGLAGFLPTATRAKADGGPITAISTIKDYVGVHYRSLTLLYAVNPNQLLDAVRDSVAFGTGAFTDGVVVQFHNQTILFSERGFRAFSVGGYLSDRADDTNIGEANEAFDPASVSLLSAAYWPYTGQYVALLSVAGTAYLYVFDYSKDSKIACWSRWQVGATPTITGTCAFVVVGARLYLILSAGGVAYLDAAAVDGQWFDDLDLTGTSNEYEYESVAECYQNDFGQKAVDKKFTQLDIVAQGTTEVTFNLLSSGVERNIPGTVVTDTTFGKSRVRLAMRGFSIAPRFASTDRNEWILDSFALDFTALQR